MLSNHWVPNDLWFAPTVISLLEIRLKLKVILQNLGNKWRMVHFQSIKRRKNRIWIDLSWIMGKMIGNVLNIQIFSLKPKRNLKNLNTIPEHSQGLSKYLFLFGFTYLVIAENVKNPQKKWNKRGKLVGMVHSLYNTLYYEILSWSFCFNKLSFPFSEGNREIVRDQVM